MLEDSDSEPSESEPLVSRSDVKRDPGIWKSNSGKSGPDSSTGAISKNSYRNGSTQPPKTTPKSGARRLPPNPGGGSTGATDMPHNPSASNSPTSSTRSGGTILSRGSSKKLQDLVSSQLEKVPENEETNSKSTETTSGNSGLDSFQTSREPSHKDASTTACENSPNEEYSSLSCPFFGVKNYLHQFYEKPNIKDPYLYEDIFHHTSDEGVFLVKTSSSSCSSPVFRLSIILGGLIFAMGALALLIAGCSTKRSPLVAKVDGVSVIDRQTATHNAEVDALLLVGMVAVVLGCSVLTAALLSRAFCPHNSESRPFRIRLLDDQLPRTMSDDLVPATEQLTAVQPSLAEMQGYTSVKGVLMMP